MKPIAITIEQLLQINQAMTSREKAKLTALHKVFWRLGILGYSAQILAEKICVNKPGSVSWYLVNKDTILYPGKKFAKVKKIPLPSLGETGVENIQKLLKENGYSEMRIRKIRQNQILFR